MHAFYLIDSRMYGPIGGFIFNRFNDKAMSTNFYTFTFFPKVLGVNKLLWYPFVSSQHM